MFDEGLLKIVVNTRNGCGSACRREEAMTLQWDASPSPDLLAYILVVGLLLHPPMISGRWEDVATVLAPVTEVVDPMPDPPIGAAYCYLVDAVDVYGRRSAVR